MKNGIVRGFQRYQCRSWRLQFHNDAAARQTLGEKALASLLYAMGNMSFGSIARILGVSDVAVLDWIRDEARKLPDPAIAAEQVIITVDEMWHFIQKELKNYGAGAPMILWLGEPSPGSLVVVMTPHAKNSSTKSASKAKRSSPTIGAATTA